MSTQSEPVPSPTGEAGGSEEGVLAVVAALIAEVIGEDYLEDVPIKMMTSFADDIEIESIEFVALAEKVREHFGDKVDFIGWIAEMELEDIMSLTVGQLVEMIIACHTS